MIKIRSVQAHNCRPYLGQLSRLHLRIGLQYPSLQEVMAAKNAARVFLALEDEKVVGWSLFQPYERPVNYYHCQVYVNAKMRRRGIGLRLMRAMAKQWKLKRQPSLYGDANKLWKKVMTQTA